MKHILRSKLGSYGMGAAMGLMMLGMVHMALPGPSDLGLWAAIGFVLAHVVVILALCALPVFVARYIPRFAKRLERLHRPSWAHVAQMLIGAGLAVVLVHFSIHRPF